MLTSKIPPAPLSALWWLWLPTGSFILLLGLGLFLPWQYFRFVVEENGLLELVHFITMLISFILALKVLRTLNFKTQRGLFLWFGIAALACFYIAGEEISWGQQFFKWATPDSWIAINDQHETNLHNTSSWLDQKPRLVLEIGVMVGGLILPLLQKYKSDMIPSWLAAIAPSWPLAVTAGFYVTVKLVDKIGDFIHLVIFPRASEINEMYMFYFVALYLAFFLKKQAVS